MAEQLVAGSGAAGLSFGSLAAAAGVPKASVQSAFNSREALIEAMLARWLCAEQQRFEATAGPDPAPQERTRAHIQTLAEETTETSSRIAALLATLAGSGDQSAGTARWYASRVGDLSAATPDERRLRIAFLAAEGAFYMRNLAGFEMSKVLWDDIFKDLADYAEGTD